MGPSIIARNYAETLLELALRSGGEDAVDSYGRTLTEVAELLRNEPRVREFLETPRVTTEERKRAVRAAFGDRVPGPLLRFLLVVVEKRRQGLLREISAEYATLVDERQGRVRAHVTLAREADAPLQQEIVAALAKRLGKTVVATFSVDPAIVGGVLVRVGDQLYDGSVRRRIVGLRRAMMGGTAGAGS
jgi:F-type H+-transporting ATPase subunit delta